MTQSLASFRAALLAGWVVLSAAGWWFAKAKGVPMWAALPVLAAFLIEYPFYLVTGFADLRERFAGRNLPLYLTASALLPFLVSCWGNGVPPVANFVRLAALALALSLWYVVLPVHPLTDLGYLAVVTAVMLSRYFDQIYLAPYPGVEVARLGNLALVHISVMVLLLERRVPNTGFGFWPTWEEWRIGGLHYLYFLAIGFPIGYAIHAMKFGPVAPLWKIAGVFFGFLWVAALAEEFFCRGVLQEWLEEWTGSRQGALILTSVLFGLAHLPFRGFPNYRWVVLASILGYCCGRARNESGGIRAAVVTHTLVVVTWRGFFV